ncbi:MAG TPA: lytic transglycosylase domain-containing protein [Thiolapillus brandeum]|uniref:Lytic transglycosylase domain-containing protein n=1 Tax=Thiolapillus brandeum TaxID=1076588 RepID=A0A831NYV2_9GAMM|nr:lytic transglycosylase domain-containing protein [Thiolapillus brandeum]
MRLPSLPWFLLALPAIALAGGFKHVDHKHWTDKYDHHFRKHSKHYFGPLVNWRWFKAQGIAESGLKPKARSKAGAMGLMQILPSTFEEIRKKNPALLDLKEPKWNIAAGIYYDRYLYDKWKFLGTETRQRLFFAFASYNAGYRRIRKAYNKSAKKLEEVNKWEQVEPYAPGATRHYVKRIRKLMQTTL